MPISIRRPQSNRPRRRNRLLCGEMMAVRIACLFLICLNFAARGQEATSLRVGTYPQEVAQHAECQTGLPSSDILAISLVPGKRANGQIAVRTGSGYAVWTGDRWGPSRGVVFMTGLSVPADGAVHQQSDSSDGRAAQARRDGLFERVTPTSEFERLEVRDSLGRSWATHDVRGVTYDRSGQLWFATKAGVGCRTESGWKFYEGKDGLPYNDFTYCAAAPDGAVWFATHRGAIRFHDGRWQYRQGKRWLPHDDVRQIVVDESNTAWFATAEGVGCIQRVPMTLDEKGEYYEQQIEQHIKRTPLGYVASVRVEPAGKFQNVTKYDTDNDGLWTSMYGAAQCFAFGATQSESAKQRAQQAFHALRFLQQVTQGGSHSPPKGYVARTIRSVDDPDPNENRLERDRQQRATGDRLWKIYEPRWPKSADGKWYWKSDTSSDELDGHYFFYAQYFDLVAESTGERDSVRSVVQQLTDHLIEHGFTLTDHDGLPTRWANFRPDAINHDYNWMPERGLNSLSMLSYLVVAHHVTGDDKYFEIAERLRRDEHYGANTWVPKVQRGVGSGNQSDDEMAFMSFYNLLKYWPTESAEQRQTRQQFLATFYWYWTLEQPECNPFFNFCYAAFGQGESITDPFDTVDLSPWPGWLRDSVDTLTGFPLDRFDWRHENSHRLDVTPLPKQQGRGTLENNTPNRGWRVNRKVLPVEERFFSHWNTDPWQLDTGGSGTTLASGAVFLLPYHMGQYHGFLE